MINIIVIIRSAFKDLAANKIRSFLTMLGIIIGISSVILVMAIGSGAQQLIVSQVTKMGTNIIGVLPGKSEMQGMPISVMGVTITSLKQEDAEAIANLPYIIAASPYATGRDTVAYQKEVRISDLTGVSPDYPIVEEALVERGYFFNQRQQSSFARVAVLGHTLAQELFGNLDPLSKNIRIRGRTFQVIGVLAEKGNTLFGKVDSQVFMPVTTIQKDLLGIDYVNSIRAKATDSSKMNLARVEIENLLRHRHGIKSADKDDFTVQTMTQMLDILKEVTGAIQAFLLLVVAISLLVGGIGIMNIMLATLSQRIKEVGLRKALGAKDQDIFLQFLVESSLLTLIGGLLGLAFGVGAGIAIAYLIRLLTGFAWYFSITFSQMILAIGVALIIGILFGLYPAQKAAKLNPIKALRYE